MGLCALCGVVCSLWRSMLSVALCALCGVMRSLFVFYVAFYALCGALCSLWRSVFSVAFCALCGSRCSLCCSWLTYVIWCRSRHRLMAVQAAMTKTRPRVTPGTARQSLPPVTLRKQIPRPQHVHDSTTRR